MSQLQVTGEAKIRDIQGPVVANDGVITALDGAASQYVRGDGTLADFPTSSGGGSSVSYYLNSSVSQGTIGGVGYRELSKDPIIGTGTDITISSNGYVASYITDANDPDVTIVPGGNFNCEFYFSVNNNTGNPFTYAELYKYDGTTFTLLGSSVGVPEYINQGTIIAPYYFAIPVPTSSLALTDRLAIRIYVNVDGRTVTLHTENSHLCQVVTTLSKGMVSLNNLTDQSQFLTTGTSGTNFAIVSSGDTHTFNLPVASATNTGKLSSTDWSTFNNKVPYTGAIGNVDLGVYGLTAIGVTANNFYGVGNGTQGGYLYLKQGSEPYAGLLGSNGISAHLTRFLLIANVNSSNNKLALFELGSLTNNTERTYTLPDASGTLALTSNLSSYVPYTGATANVDLGIYSLTASSLKVYESSGSSGSLVLYTGTTGYNYGIDAISLVSSPTVANTLLISSDVSGVRKIAQIGLGSLSATRTYTLPDLSGTLALLEGTQTFTGANTFNNSVRNEYGTFIKQNQSDAVPSGYKGLFATTNGLEVTNSNTSSAFLNFNNAGNYTYTFPAASGTLALTSDLGAYVTLATTQTISGLKTFTALATNNEAIGIKLTSGVVSTGGYLTLNAKVVGTLHSLFLAPDSTTNRVEITFDNTALRTYALPNASGTLALTSNLSAYLPLAGGTLTGNLTGTTAIFNGSVDVVNGQINLSNSYYLTARNNANNTYLRLIGRNPSDKVVIDTDGYGTILGGALSGTSATFSSSVQATNMSIGIAPQTDKLFVYNASGTNTGVTIQQDGTGDIFRANGNSGANRFVVQQGGNVGIGTSSPGNFSGVGFTGPFLDVAGVLQVKGTSANGVAIIQLGGDTYRKATIETSIGTQDPYLAFGTSSSGSSSSGTERMRITSGGDVSIGTTSVPFATANRKVLTLNGGSNGALFGLSVNNVNDAYFYTDGANTYIHRNATTGNIYVTANTNGVYLANGGIAWISNSDEKLKTDLINIEDAANKVSSLRSVIGRYKTDKEGTKRPFLIAQDVLKVLPEAVNKNEKTGDLGVSYTEVIPLLVAAIKEQQAQIDELSNKIVALQSK